MNCSEEWAEISRALEKYCLSTMYAFEFIVGIIGNSIVVFGYIFCLKTWRSGNIYLFNLTLSDIAFLCTLPELVSSYSKDILPYNITWCIINRFFLHGNLYTSILFLTFISIDRYLLIKYPFRNNVMQKRSMAILFSLAIWIAVLMEVLPMLISISRQNDTSKCLDFASSGDAEYTLIYSMVLTIIGFIIPLCIMCFFYMKIHTYLKRRNSELTAVPTLEKPLTLIIMAMGIFMVLFTPYHIMRNLRIASRLAGWKHSTVELIKIVYIPTRPIAFLNSVINPIFYFLMGDHFREMLMSKLRYFFKRFIPCCSEVRCIFQTDKNHSEG
ncbi:succinate receptor 1 [Varanus komodoensis]|nr:succinate receptor 1 [Varanus komodoensis]